MTLSPAAWASHREKPYRSGSRPRLYLALIVMACLPPIVAQAQSFDCRQARSPVDQAICASSRLRELDTALARTYAAALGRDAAAADAVRRDQQIWARGRSACLAGARAQVAGKETAEQCLATAYLDRMAALAAPPANAAAPARPDSVAPRSASNTPPPVSMASPVPVSSAAGGREGRVGPATGDASAQQFAEPRLATGSPVSPPAAATMERTRIPTAGETGVLLRVTAPGRFAIRAESPTGTAVQLVDMLTGPGDQAGWAGKQDGRIDALLDVGTYKVRASGDPAATGDTVLSVAPFTPAAAAQIAPGYMPVALTLRDLQIQSFWLVIGDAAGTTRIEAAGRGLAALKLWRDGRDLVDLTEETAVIAPVPAHPMTDIVLSGHPPSGTYLVTAYGGPPLPWSDGSPDEPLYARTGRSPDLLAGGGNGQVGVFGTEIFDVPADADTVLATLPRAADLLLRATASGASTMSAKITKSDRDPRAFLALPARSAAERTVELRAKTGEPFNLRPLPSGGPPPDRAGRFWLGVAEPANGGDEAPAAAVLARVTFDRTLRRDSAPEVLTAPGVPSVESGQAWRTRFNLRGDTSLLFRARDVVTVAVRTDGPPVTPRISTIDGAVLNAMGDGRAANLWSLSPGWYRLNLAAAPDAIGILDLTLGPPDLVPPTPEPPGRPAPILPLGEYERDAQYRLVLSTNGVPGGAPAWLNRTIPVELSDGPLVQSLPPGTSRTVAVHARKPGILVVRDIAGGAPLESRPLEADAATSVELSTSDREQTIAIALLPPPTGLPQPAPPPGLTVLRDDQPAFLDLDRDETASFDLTVARGGLYRVETKGRLKTKGSIGTAFIPMLDEATANGVGDNMLLQRYLRAGRYHLDVTAQESAGRLGISATVTPLATGSDLLPGGSTRATLSPGLGFAFPIHIAETGRYQLDLLGDGRVFSARLEDADGWPIRAAGDPSSIDQVFQAGDYRLIVQPPGVQARVVARLRRIEPPVELSGHGPHVLPFDRPQALEWREPPARGGPRAPDIWTFALAGPAHVALSLDGDGMTATLQSDAADQSAPPIGRLLAGTKFVTELPAGRYRVAALSLGRNDRLAYTVSLHTDELQPVAPRRVTLPAEVPFAIATPRVVTLTSFGAVPLRAELRDESGHGLARAAGRTDDWNIALSRFLPAGRYRLALAPLRAPTGKATSNPTTTGSDTGEGMDNGPEDTDNPAADQPAAENTVSDEGNTDQPDQDDQTASNQSPARTEVTLSLPADGPDSPLNNAGAARLSGDGIQHVALPPAPSGGLLVVAAEAPVELILALEQQVADGSWWKVGQSQGLAPILATEVGDGVAARRIAVWTVDGGVVPIRVASRVLRPAAVPIGDVALAPVALEGITRRWQAALVADPGATMLRVTGPIAGLLSTSAPDQPAVPVSDGTIVAQSDGVWLLAPEPGSPRLEAVRTEPGTELAIAIPGSGRASLPIAASASSSRCAYTAVSGLGQPGLDAGRGMGVASGSTFALCGGATLTAWNASGEAPLRVRLRRHELALQPDRAVDQAFVGLLPAHAAVKLRLPAGTKRLDVSLAANEALVTGGQSLDSITVWAAEAPLSRALTGDWSEALLANPGDAPAPVALGVTSVSQPLALGSGEAFRRFFGAGGSFELPLSAKPGQNLMLAGDAAALVRFADGQVRQGQAISLDGAASAIVTHGTGPLALWIEGPDVSPWPAVAPRDVTVPLRLALEHEAMALRLSPGVSMLLRLASTAPVILTIAAEPPVLFGNGVTLARYLPAEETMVRLLSPQDGPLSGTLELSGSPVIDIGEGLGSPVAIAPGGAAVFGFTLRTPATIGLGVRADPDRVAARLLNERGETIASGVSMLRDLAPGRYLLEATVPADAPTTLVRPAVLGTVPPPNPPPVEVIRGLLLAAGLKPPDAAR
jgi:uncharacterized protein